MLSGFELPQQDEAPTHTATSGRGELDAVDLTEAGGEDGGRGAVVAEPIGPVRCLRAVDPDHQVAISQNLARKGEQFQVHGLERLDMFKNVGMIMLYIKLYEENLY